MKVSVFEVALFLFTIHACMLFSSGFPAIFDCYKEAVRIERYEHGWKPGLGPPMVSVLQNT